MSELAPSGSPARRPSAWASLVIVLLMAALLLTGLWFWRASKAGGGGWAGGGPLDVVAVTLEARAAPLSVRALGELRAVRQVQLPAEVAGRVSVLSFEAGQTVKAGAVLAQLDDVVEQADLAAARAQAIFARQQLSRAKPLAASGALSGEVLQQRQAEHDRAAAQVQQLQARIRQKRVVAPFGGELGLRRIDLGQYLNAGDIAVTLTDLDRLFVNFDVPQQELGRVRIGQQLSVDPGVPGTPAAQATIRAIEPQVGRDTRNASVQAVMENPGRTLRPGMYVTVAVALPPEPDALVLPASAVMTSASGNTALLVRDLSAEKLGKAEIVPITVGRRVGDSVVVTRGLKAGDVVVTEGQSRAQPGVALRVVDKSATARRGAQP